MRYLINTISIFIILLISSCLSSNESKEVRITSKQNKMIFLSLNEFTLEGVNKVDDTPNSYPYLHQVKSNINEKEFILHVSAGEAWNQKYFKKYGRWVSKMEFSEADENYVSYMICDSVTIFDFTLWKTNDSLMLVDLSVRRDNEQKRYRFSSDFILFSSEDEVMQFNIHKLEQSLSMIKSDNVNLELTTWEFYENNTFLFYLSKQLDFSSLKVLESEKSCFKSNKEISFFWWSLIGPYRDYCQKINCNY